MSSRSQLRREDMHDYQDGPEGAVQFMKDHPFSGLFMDTGLGKTGSVGTLLSDLLGNLEFDQALIVAPLRVAAQTWPNEFPQWEHLEWIVPELIRAEDDDPEVISAGKAAYQTAFMSRELGLRAVEVMIDLWELGDTTDGGHRYAMRQKRKWAESAAGKARTAAKERVRQKLRRSRRSIHVIDVGHLEWLVEQYTEWTFPRRGRKKREIRNWPYQVVILDESSLFKDHTTARFKALQAVRISGQIERLHLLTATPASETYLHLFGQIFLLDLGERLGRNITAYRDRYFTLSRNGFTWKIRPGGEEEISEAISDICLTMKARDYLDEEEPLMLPRRIKMNPVAMALYKDFERHSVLPLGEDREIVEAITAADLKNKLLQLASGAIYRPDGSYELFHEEKIADLQQLREELGPDQPIFVAYWFQHTKDRLKAAFPKMKFMDKKGALVTPWNEGKIANLAAHPQGVAHGLNMQYGPGHDVYFFDVPHSRELFYQFWRRLARQGQKKQVRVWLPQMIDTADYEVVEAQRLKEDAEERLFRYIKAIRARMKEDQL